MVVRVPLVVQSGSQSCRLEAGLLRGGVGHLKEFRLVLKCPGDFSPFVLEISLVRIG